MELEKMELEKNELSHIACFRIISELAEVVPDEHRVKLKELYSDLQWVAPKFLSLRIQELLYIILNIPDGEPRKLALSIWEKYHNEFFLEKPKIIP